MQLYAEDGRCHNSEPGTFNHECGKPAKWIGTKASGFQSGFCDHCKQHGTEARPYTKWEQLPDRRYTFMRFDTLSREKRWALMAQAPGWMIESQPQFAIIDPDGKPADWPLVSTLEQAIKDCREFNAILKDDDGAGSEARWQARMAGDLEA